MVQLRRRKVLYQCEAMCLTRVEIDSQIKVSGVLDEENCLLGET